jgi:hypothetical protein
MKILVLVNHDYINIHFEGIKMISFIQQFHIIRRRIQRLIE